MSTSEGPAARRRGAGGVVGAVVASLRNPNLLRAELAFGAAWAAEWMFTVAIGVYAFAQDGAAGVGVVSVVRFVPAAALAPVISSLADRHRRELVLAQISLVRAGATAAAALVLSLDGPTAVVYLCATVSTIAITPFRAAHSALLPSLCQTPEELASSNVVRGSLDSLSVVVGPLVAAAIIDVTEVWVALAVAAATALVSALLVTNLSYDPPPREVAATTSIGVAVREGLRASVVDRDVRSLILLCLVQTFLRGCLTVFTVVMAIDLLDLGEPGAGLLQAAVGVGAIAGSIGTALLVGSRSLTRWFAVSVMLWGLPFCFVGLAPNRAVALLMLGVVGVANAVLDVGFFTVMGRLVPDAVLARVFGIFESAVAGSVALGAAAAAFAVDAFGVRPALLLLGALGPIAAAAGWTTCARVDGVLDVRSDEIDILRSVPMLRGLPVPTIEHLARQAQRRRFAPGETIVRRGTIGMRFFVVTEGQVDVFDDVGLVRTMGVGQGFGEIALLREGRRTIDVRAGSTAGSELCTVTRDDFVTAVTGVRTATAAAAVVVEAWLAADHEGRS